MMGEGSSWVSMGMCVGFFYSEIERGKYRNIRGIMCGFGTSVVISF